MRVLVADKLPPSALAEMRRLGFQVDAQPDIAADELEQHLKAVDVLIVRSTRVTAQTLNASDTLRLVIRAGAGTSNVDVERASARAIYVANCPGKNAVAVAELTLGLLFALDRRIPAAHAELVAGRWNKKEFAQATGIQGRSLGIVGTGEIGQAVASRARALGMHVSGWSKSFSPQRADALGIGFSPTLSELAETSDVLSIHLPLTDATRHLINGSVLDALPDGAFLINVSRGGVVDESAVLDALEAGRLWYATDVFEQEPGASQAPFEDAIAAHPRAVCTPHIGASTAQAQDAVAAEALRVLRDFRDTGVVHNCVNLCDPTGGWLLTVRHLNKVGVLATVLGLLRDAHINVEELENLILTGEVAACAQIQLSGEPSADVLASVRACPEVIGATLRAVAFTPSSRE